MHCIFLAAARRLDNFILANRRPDH
jgi:hypothetical protein